MGRPTLLLVRSDYVSWTIKVFVIEEEGFGPWHESPITCSPHLFREFSEENSFWDWWHKNTIPVKQKDLASEGCHWFWRDRQTAQISS